MPDWGPNGFKQSSFYKNLVHEHSDTEPVSVSKRIDTSESTVDIACLAVQELQPHAQEHKSTVFLFNVIFQCFPQLLQFPWDYNEFEPSLGQKPNGSHTPTPFLIHNLDPWCLMQAPNEMGAQYNDVLSAQDVAVYGGLCALASFDRQELKTHVINNVSFRDYMEVHPEVFQPAELHAY